MQENDPNLEAVPQENSPEESGSIRITDITKIGFWTTLPT